MVRFCHVNGPKNCFADYLSRYVLDDFRLCEIGIQTEHAPADAICLATSAVLDPPEGDKFNHLLKNWDMDTNSE